MAMFKKKPVEVEARQFDGTVDGAEAICRWANDNVDAHEDGEPWVDYTYVNGTVIDLLVHTLEGSMEAKPGDWIIRGVKGEFYPVRADIFAETYERA